MAHNKLYRNFIILQADENIHSSSDKKAMSGYAKIEAKGDRCKISFYVQNLKKDQKYNIAIICCRANKQMVDLGVLNVNDAGMGENTKEYYVNNIGGVDISFDEISGAALLKMEEENPKFIMYGFINGEIIKDDWKKLKVIKHNKEKECVEGKKEEVQIVVKPEHKKEEHKEMEHKEEEHKEEKHKEEEHKEEEHHCNVCEKKEMAKIDFDKYEKELNKKKENQEIDPFEFEMKGAIGKYFNEIVKDFEKSSDKYKEIKYCKWFKAKVNSIEDMCDTKDYNKYVIAYYPMLNYYPYIKEYGFFMIGYKCTNKGELEYIIYGVPGKKDIEEQPYGGKTGFVTWMKEENSDMGCWLMFYDYKKSIVVVPAKS